MLYGPLAANPGIECEVWRAAGPGFTAGRVPGQAMGGNSLRLNASPARKVPEMPGTVDPEALRLAIGTLRSCRGGTTALCIGVHSR